MNKEFVPYEQALELKELGFDEGYYFARYVDSANLIPREEEDGWAWHLTKSAKAPTFSQSFRWFREKYGLHQHIEYVNVADRYEGWVSGIMFDCKTYEEAELACLKKLIQLIKGK
jgi:predicted GNAT superfamily acetyltransferase